MSEEHIELLKKALDLYAFTIEQHKLFPNYNVEDIAFFEMREALSEIVGTDLTD